MDRSTPSVKHLRRAVLSLLLLCAGHTVLAEVRLPHGIFYQDIEALRIKVMGGPKK